MNVSMSIDCAVSGFTIDWASDIATYGGGYMTISKNSTTVVNVTTTTSGSFSAANGDSLVVTMNGVTFSNYQVDALIYVDSTLQSSNAATNSVTITYSFTVSGDHYISGVAYDNF